MAQTEPQFKPGDRAFSHYTRDRHRGISGWMTVKEISHTDRDRTHGVTGSKLDDTTWYYTTPDEGGSELLDDAHGNWEMARLVPPHIAKQYGYGDDPNPPQPSPEERAALLAESRDVEEGRRERREFYRNRDYRDY